MRIGGLPTTGTCSSKCLEERIRYLLTSFARPLKIRSAVNQGQFGARNASSSALLTDIKSDTLLTMRIALYQPDIPQNTGTILRLAACMNVAVDIIEPAGFDLSDRSLRRAGLDYLDHVDIARHQSWQAFHATLRTGSPRVRLILMTTKAPTRHVDFEFRATDTILFGRESAGVSDEVATAADHRLKIPLAGDMRSLNVAVSVAMTLGEALRQTDGFAPASTS